MFLKLVMSSLQVVKIKQEVKLEEACNRMPFMTGLR
jgi:hypothetical protein